MRHLLLLLALLPTGASGSNRPTTPWAEVVTYEIFVRAFADSDGDGIGDLRGATAKLDHLKGLGVQAVWLMPFNPSPTYHKYDVTDYEGIHPDYGTMEDFEEFVAQAHRRGIRVIMDLVINHTSNRHPWFEAAARDPLGPDGGFYVWKTADEIDSLTVETTGPDTDNLQRWHPAPGTDGMFYYAYFTGGMPDLNFDNPAVREEVFNIGRFWLEKGVDGFRLDAAMHIFPDERTADSVAFWKDFRAAMQKVNPNVLLVGEVWADSDKTGAFLPALGSVFNFELAGAILNAVRTGRGEGLAARHEGILARYAASAPGFIDATFLSNHDQNRVMSAVGGEEKARVAASILLTLPGAPYLYYGEEIGMLGEKPDPFIREPMLWRKPPDPSRPTDARARFSTDTTVRPVAQQQEDRSSLLRHYRDLIRLRNTTPALRLGGLEPIEGMPVALVAFVRRDKAGDVVVLHNVSVDTVTARLPEPLLLFDRIVWRSATAAIVESKNVTLPGLSSIVLGAATQ